MLLIKFCRTPIETLKNFERILYQVHKLSCIALYLKLLKFIV